MKRFSAEGVENLWPRGGIDVATLTGKSGKLYVIRMMSEVAKEGALRISLFDPERGRLASITGVLGCDSKGKSCFWIGALQGAVADGKQAVVAVTKDLNGLRPKQAVLQAAAVVCLWFGVEEMVGPSLGNQVADKTRAKAQKIHTEYDEFWQEFTGGATDERGDYILSLPLPRRKLEEVQQKRRKNWTLRYARVDAMKAEIEDCLKKL